MNNYAKHNNKPHFCHADFFDYSLKDLESSQVKINTEKEYKDILNILKSVGANATFSVEQSTFFERGFYEITLVNNGLQEIVAYYEYHD